MPPCVPPWRHAVDYTVRDYHHRIIQFKYNNTGLDPKYQVAIPGHGMQFVDIEAAARAGTLPTDQESAGSRGKHGRVAKGGPAGGEEKTMSAPPGPRQLLDAAVVDRLLSVLVSGMDPSVITGTIPGDGFLAALPVHTDAASPPAWGGRRWSVTLLVDHPDLDVVRAGPGGLLPLTQAPARAQSRTAGQPGPDTVAPLITTDFPMPRPGPVRSPCVRAHPRLHRRLPSKPRTRLCYTSRRSIRSVGKRGRGAAGTEICCICLELLGEGVSTLPCRHTLHSRCLWAIPSNGTLGANGMMRCPLCRADVDRHSLGHMG